VALDAGGEAKMTGAAMSTYEKHELEPCLLTEDILETVSQPDAVGYLLKRAGLGWYKYWFSLKGSDLMYFEKKGKWRGPMVARISLFNAKVAVADPNKRALEFDVVDHSGKTHTLKAISKLEMQYWLTMFAGARKKIPPPRPIIKVEAAEASRLINNIRTERVPGHMPVDRVLMVVHGIGTREDILTKNAGTLQQTNREVMDKIFPDVQFNLEVLVVHWRESVLNLKTHEDIMRLAPSFQGSNALREFILNRVFDALYYTRDRLRNFLWREVVSQLNAHYAEFRQRHPEFKGKVCLYAHSLGGVIIYEILSRQVTDDPRLLASEGIKLDFEAESLYAVGCPLGGFLALEFNMGTINLRPDRLPFRVYNIFHPNDPVAMRIEPVVNDRFTFVSPVVLPHWWTMDKKQNAVKWLGGLWKNKRDGEKRSNQSDASDGSGPAQMSRRASSPGPQLSHELGRRYDFTLQVTSAIEEVSTAYSAMKAHTEYWSSHDAMLFLLSTMIRESAKNMDKHNSNASRMTMSMFQLIVAGQQNGDSDAVLAVSEFLTENRQKLLQQSMTVEETVNNLVAHIVDTVAMEINRAALHSKGEPIVDRDGEPEGVHKREVDSTRHSNGGAWWSKWFHNRVENKTVVSEGGAKSEVEPK